MNLFIICIATIIVKNNFVLAVPEFEDCGEPAIQNESLQLEIAFDQFKNIITEPPEALLKIVFGDAEADLGNEICVAKTVVFPFYQYDEIDPEALYTVIGLNVDVPSKATSLLSPYLNALGINILGAEVNQKIGDIVGPWIGPTPSPSAGPQRIVMLLYEQSCRVEIDRSILDKAIIRYGFNLTEFVTNNNLRAPVAGNYFVSLPVQCEDSCNCHSSK